MLPHEEGHWLLLLHLMKMGTAAHVPGTWIRSRSH